MVSVRRRARVGMWVEVRRLGNEGGSEDGSESDSSEMAMFTFRKQ